MARLANPNEGGKAPRKPAPQRADRAYDEAQAKKKADAAKVTPTSKDDKDTGVSTGATGGGLTTKTVVSTVDNGDGTFTETWSDGTITTKGTKNTSGKGDPTGAPGKAWKWNGIQWVKPSAPDDGSKYNWDDNTGWKLDNPNIIVPPGPTDETKDAFANLHNVLSQYRLGTLSATLKKLMATGYSAGDAYNKIKYDNSTDPDTGKAWNEAYALRFAGNAKLVAKGKNAITEEAYLRLEDSMSQTLQAYGYGKMLGADRMDNEARIGEWIGNNWNADDFNSLVKNVHLRVDTADPAIMQQMAEYYPELDKTDLFTYFINPKEGLASMNRKITMGEVGAAFKGQKLDSSVANIGGLVDYGVDRQTALEGAANIAEVLPDTGKLADIYGETGIKYNQQTAQDEFLKNNASAQKKRKLLASAERGSFSGSSGNLTGQRASTAGLF